MRLAVQYLEPSPGTDSVSPLGARRRLREAGERLPISHVLLGWDLAQELVEAVAAEARSLGAALYRWQPLLTGDGAITPQSQWQCIGLGGESVVGFAGMPEFTFLCPNRPVVREMVLVRLEELARQAIYDGVFLDRIRYPSPAARPRAHLACFCPDCGKAAATSGLDLDEVRFALRRLTCDSEHSISYARALLAAKDPMLGEAINRFFKFRCDSVAGIVREAAEALDENGLLVGLDCFSPSVAQMVGQDLSALHQLAEWTKVMSYTHALGPAGLPFELLGLLAWLIDRGVDEQSALTQLASVTGLPLPKTRTALRAMGLPPSALSAEAQRAREAGVRRLWLGIELVEIPGVAHLSPGQVLADLAAAADAAVDGLVLSWDLWYIPLDRLDQVSQAMGF